ncbi:unnamed protein product, partial [marine sediment metagenome]
NQGRRGGGLLPAFQGVKVGKVKKNCQGCGDEFEAYDFGKHSRRYCDKCAEAKIAEEEEKQRQAGVALAEARYREFVAQARIPKLWREVTFENSDTNLNKAAFRVAKRYADNFSAESGTLVLYSQGYGCGKTHLAACVANHVLHQLRRPVLFKKARDLLLEIRSTFSERGTETEAHILDQVLSVELLILDDVGVDNPSLWIESTYWTVFDRRVEWQLPTIVTANYPLEGEADEVSLGDRIGYGAPGAPYGGARARPPPLAARMAGFSASLHNEPP